MNRPLSQKRISQLLRAHTLVGLSNVTGPQGLALLARNEAFDELAAAQRMNDKARRVRAKIRRRLLGDDGARQHAQAPFNKT